MYFLSDSAGKPEVNCFCILFITEILAAKKKKYSELARRINQTKTEIDESRVKLDRLKDEREANGNYYIQLNYRTYHIKCLVKQFHSL